MDDLTIQSLKNQAELLEEADEEAAPLQIQRFIGEGRPWLAFKVQPNAWNYIILCINIIFTSTGSHPNYTKCPWYAYVCNFLRFHFRLAIIRVCHLVWLALPVFIMICFAFSIRLGSACLTCCNRSADSWWRCFCLLLRRLFEHRGVSRARFTHPESFCQCLLRVFLLSDDSYSFDDLARAQSAHALSAKLSNTCVSATL